MDEKITKLFLPVLERLYNTEPAGEPFRKPVDVVKYGCFDYYLYVKHPIDLSTIRERLEGRQYKDAWRFVADIELMFSNAYLFNKRGTPVYEFTNKLNKIWSAELATVMRQLNYCCASLHKFGPQLLFCHGTTPDRYCQIAIGAKYKCYQDQYSFCVPCFNKIPTQSINIQSLSSETRRMKLPQHPVNKADFKDCANDSWQYEPFVQCSHCSRRLHQICELYPAHPHEINHCPQHEQIELEQKRLCRVPIEYRVAGAEEEQEQELDKLVPEVPYTIQAAENQLAPHGSSNHQHNQPATPIAQTSRHKLQQTLPESAQETSTTTSLTDELSLDNTSQATQTSGLHLLHTKPDNSSQDSAYLNDLLDDELLRFAKDVDDSHSTGSPMASPNSRPLTTTSISRSNSAKDTCHTTTSTSTNNTTTTSTINIKTTQSKISVDNIAARLSINKISAAEQAQQLAVVAVVDNNNQPNTQLQAHNRDKFMCNHCYRKKNVGYNMRHRKFSARRLPQTRMSRYIETKVNEQLREISPTAGEITIRVLTAYRDTVEVKPEMQAYVKRCRDKPPSQQHPYAKDYPESFGFTNRAIFAWQEIDGVDVCVFGMHVQEYGEDCQEPNRQVIYLSYLDSVHFFRPKQYRTTVYHEILLSYFKYVKKLGFRRVFIWVCPSRKGDDYIFYRHPNEQKMPTLRRLSDWYLNLLDKGVMAGIVEKHHSIYQFVASQNDMSPLSMPYLSGDYWPGEFERLLKIMIDSEGQYAVKIQRLEGNKDPDSVPDQDTFGGQYSCIRGRENLLLNAFETTRARHSLTSTQDFYQTQPNFNLSSLINPLRLKAPAHLNSVGVQHFTPDGDLNISATNNESKLYGAFTPDSSKSEYDQPLDLSKSSSNNSPESFFDDDRVSELSFTMIDSRKKRSRGASFSGGRGKKRAKTQVATQDASSNRRASSRNPQYLATYDPTSCKLIRPSKQKSASQSHRDSIYNDSSPCTPEDELIKNLEKSLKRQKEGFIVARLNDCDCPPNFENQRRKEEATIVCDLMNGREPFLQLTRQKNYEFSTLRRAKFSSLAMVKHLAETFKLDPICHECYSFDSTKRHYACTSCEDYYLCTSCHENTQHVHIMSLTAPTVLPDIDEFLQQCSLTPASNSISSASSTVSNKSYSDNTLEIAPPHPSLNLQSKQCLTQPITPLNHHLSNPPIQATTTTTMPLSCQRQNNHSSDTRTKFEDEENSELAPFNSNSTNKSRLAGNGPATSPARSSDNSQNNNEFNINLDQILIENFVRQAEVTYDLDFDQMKSESKKLLAHYWNCPNRESCHKCKFVVLSCSFMSAIMKSSRMQMMINQCNPSEIMPSNISNSNLSGINLTTTHQIGYQSKEK